MVDRMVPVYDASLYETNPTELENVSGEGASLVRINFFTAALSICLDRQFISI